MAVATAAISTFNTTLCFSSHYIQCFGFQWAKQTSAFTHIRRNELYLHECDSQGAVDNTTPHLVLV